MNPPLTGIRIYWLLVVAAIVTALAIGMSGAPAAPSGVTPPNTNTSNSPQYSSPQSNGTANAAGTSPIVNGALSSGTATSAGLTPVSSSTTTIPTGLNSSPATSAGTFPNDISRFSQSSALLNSSTATPLPGTITPFGNPTPNPAQNPTFPR